MKKVIFIASLFISFQLFGHGGNKPGPHGGKIKMPGMFHTELILNDQNSFKVYLLDMKFKNPTIKRSTVHYSIDNGKMVPCSPKNNFYLCKTKKILKKEMTLKIHAKRIKSKGTAIYKSLLGKAKSKTKSNMHH